MIKAWHLVVIGFFGVMVSGCRNQKINITSSYIEFPSDTKFLNGFHITKLEVSDSLVPPRRYSENLNEKYGILTDESFTLEKKNLF
jgi:tmRNA-binding protein